MPVRFQTYNTIGTGNNSLLSLIGTGGNLIECKSCPLSINYMLGAMLGPKIKEKKDFSPEEALRLENDFWTSMGIKITMGTC